MTIDKRDSSVVVVIEDAGAVKNAGDALNLLADANYHHQSTKLLFLKECFDEPFFDLSTGLAGEILQKFTNYGVAIAIVGDFGGYQSKSLRDFICESNKHGQVLFLKDRDEALNRLHEAQ